MNEQRADVSAAHQVLFIVWAGIAFSQILFFVLVWVIKPELFRFDLSGPLLGRNPLLVLIIALVSVATLAMSIILGSKHIKRSMDEQKPELVQTGMIIGVALAESVTLFGLLLAFVADYQYFFVFMIVGLLATCLHFPRRTDLENASFRKL